MWISTRFFVYYYIASFRCLLSESISGCYYSNNFQIMQEKILDFKGGEYMNENFLNTFRALLTKYREKYINYNILYTLTKGTNCNFCSIL